MRFIVRLATALYVSFALLTLVAVSGNAQSNPIYVPLGRVKGALYKPDAGPAPHVGVVVTHRTGNYLNHPACTELSKRGFMVLCMNSRFDNNEIQVRWEQIALDVQQAVTYLKKQPGITKVVLLAHSGGGPTFSFYQAVAEKGVSFCQDPKKLTQCGDDLAGLPPADGIVFIDAHPGLPTIILKGLNPSVTSEQNPLPASAIDPSLDPFNPANGYNPNGPSKYSEEFQKRYYAAQSRRMNALIDHALAIQKQIKEGRYGYSDNDIMLIPRAGGQGGGFGGEANLALLDPDNPMNKTKRPERVLKNDGSIVKEMASSVLPGDPKIAETNTSFEQGTKIFDLKSFLSANAIRSTNSLDGADYCSSNNSTMCALRIISVPEVFVSAGASPLVSDVELEYDTSKSADKDYVVVEGATHGFTPCTACEKTKGQYSNVVKNTYDYIAAWINKRF